MWKKFVKVLLSTCLLLTLFAVDARAGDTETGGKCGDLTWELKEGVLTISGEGTMTGTLDSAGNVVLPWYSHRSEITELVVEPGAAALFPCAFQDFANLTTVTLPDSVHRIDSSAFENCASLENITMPNDKVTVESRAFRDCVRLSGIVLPDNTVLKEYAFSGCTKLKNINIPNSVSIIKNDTFSDCSSLTSIVIPDGVTQIGARAFSGCSSLTNLVIPPKVTNIGENAFTDCSSLTSLEIPKSVTSIGGNAFFGCENLTNMTIPDSVSNLETYGLFCECTNLRSVRLPESIDKIGDYAFKDCAALENIVFGNNATSKGIVIPKGVTSIGALAFWNCAKITSVTIPKGVTSIETYTFNQCYMLKSLTLPNSITNIGENAFWMCYSLKDIYYNGSEEQWSQVSIDSTNDPYTSNITVHYMGEEPDDPVLAAPVLKAAAGAGSVRLTWNQIDGAAGYEISRSVSQNGRYDNLQTISGGNKISFTDTEVKAGIVYYYKIRAFSLNNGKTVYSDDSAVASAKPVPAKVNVSGIRLSGLSNKIAAGKKVKLTADISPSNATDKSVKWTSSNTKVATVDSSGTVLMKGNSGGKSVTIMAVVQDGSGVKATYKITSMKSVVKKVAISGKKSVKAGKTLKLKVKVSGTKKANKKVKWVSSNKKYATVSKTGKVKFLKAGKGKKVKITAIATDGSGKKKSITIKIK